MEIKQVTEVIGYRIVGTGIFCTYGVDRLNDSIIEVIQDYMKDRQEKESIIDIYDKNKIDIHHCGEDDLNYIDDYSETTIWIFSSFEEFACLNDINDKFKSLDDLSEADRNRLRSHSNGYVSRIIY